MLNKCVNFFKYLMPYGCFLLLKKIKRDFKDSKFYLNKKDSHLFGVLNQNSYFKNIHKNQRCFIVGTGPSINKIDIKKLNKEKCIFLSQFYLHKDYLSLSAKYHFITGVALHDDITEEVGLRFYRQIEQKISKDTIIFLDYKDRQFILKHKLLINNKIYYLFFNKNLSLLSEKGLNATKGMYGAQGIVAMALQLSIYMGFKEIYLLGIDHCWDAVTGASHFYDPIESVVDSTTLKKEEIIADMSLVENSYRSFILLLDQYRLINEFANLNDIKIFNATKGGVLEIFIRKEYETLF